MSDLPRPDWCNADSWARECDHVRKTHHWLEPDPITRAPLRYHILVDSRWETYDERRACGSVVYGWRGRLRPFASDNSEEELWKLISELDSVRRPRIGIREDGSLGHLDEECREDHTVHAALRAALSPLGQLDSEYLVEIVYQRPPAYPVVRSLDPRITRAEFPDMPHPLRDRNGLCVSYPPDVHWAFDSHGASLFADHAILFLARHTLWLKLRGKIKDPWLGVWAPHTPFEMLKALPTDPCQCSTGLPFRGCCRPKLVEQVRREQAFWPHAIASTELAWVDSHFITYDRDTRQEVQHSIKHTYLSRALTGTKLFAPDLDLLERGRLLRTLLSRPSGNRPDAHV